MLQIERNSYRIMKLIMYLFLSSRLHCLMKSNSAEHNYSMKKKKNLLNNQICTDKAKANYASKHGSQRHDLPCAARALRGGLGAWPEEVWGHKARPHTPLTPNPLWFLPKFTILISEPAFQMRTCSTLPSAAAASLKDFLCSPPLLLLIPRPGFSNQSRRIFRLMKNRCHECLGNIIFTARHKKALNSLEARYLMLA